MGIDQIKDSLDIVIQRLRTKYNPEQVILFGSYAKGNADEASDIDILVVSPAFKNRDMYDVYSELYGVMSDFEKDIQVFGTSKENLPKYKTFQHALETGVAIL